MPSPPTDDDAAATAAASVVQGPSPAPPPPPVEQDDTGAESTAGSSPTTTSASQPQAAAETTEEVMPRLVEGQIVHQEEEQEVPSNDTNSKELLERYQRQAESESSCLLLNEEKEENTEKNDDSSKERLRRRYMSMNSGNSLDTDAMMMNASTTNSSEEGESRIFSQYSTPQASTILSISRSSSSVTPVQQEQQQQVATATTETQVPLDQPTPPLAPATGEQEEKQKEEPEDIKKLPPPPSSPPAPPSPPPPPPRTVTLPSTATTTTQTQTSQSQQQPQTTTTATTSAHSASSSSTVETRIRLGICAMDKKARSRPMTQILSRLDDLLFDVVFFGDDLILNQNIESWPICDVVIAFFSKGYPLQKAKDYVALRQPYILNDLEKQELLQDRRQVYDLLEASGIDVPRHVYLSRDGYQSTGTGDGNGAGETEVHEYDDHIVINGTTIHKPFVEKPVNAEDHNIAIYYPTTAGGGCKKLFRKIGNRSSEFYPNINEVRRDGSYIYEEFVETQGTDVKMYTVGPEYGHAEARKSPTVDGKVERNSDGKEVRFPVILTFREKEIARRIVLVFQQFVCGFDILRVQEGHAVVSYVCDVNGWSFVKNSRKYYDDCAQILSEHILALVKPAALTTFSTLDPLALTIANDNASITTRDGKDGGLRDFMSLHQLPEEGGTVGGDDETVSEGASILEGQLPLPPPNTSISAGASVTSTTNNTTSTGGAVVVPASPLIGRGGRNTFLTRAARMLQGECGSGDDEDEEEDGNTKTNKKDQEEKDTNREQRAGSLEDVTMGGTVTIDDGGLDCPILGEQPQQPQQQQQQQPLAILASHHSSSPSRCPETGELLSNAAATLQEGAVPVREFPSNLMSEPASLAQSSNSSYVETGPCSNGEEEDNHDDDDENAQSGLSDMEDEADEGKHATHGTGLGSGVVSVSGKEKKKSSTSSHQKMPSSSGGSSSSRRRRSSVAGSLSTRQEELRCVLAIVRHGDRTPKQKLKVNMTEPHILKYFHDHSKEGAADKDLKVKAKQPMTEFLETVKTTLDELADNSSSKSKSSTEGKKKNKAVKAAAGVQKKGTDQGNLRHQLMHMRDILERWKIAGLNRKLQIKPKKFEEHVDEETGEVKRKCTQVQLILKWGGNLTKLGEKQAINLGHKHRREMYPDAPGGGILRLHSTFRHDLKIKTSDEGRVMKTAAAFAKGMLELEGDLPPILVSLVHKEKGSMHMLDPSGNKEVKMELDECKEKITANLQRDIEVEQASEDDLYQLVGPKQLTSLRLAIKGVHNPRKTLGKIHHIMGKLINQLEEMLDNMGSGDERRIEGGEGLQGQDENDVALSGVKLYKGETLLELTERWRFIYDRLYDAETDQFDLSRIPDVHDNTRFDVLHNPHLGLSSTLEELYQLAKNMADCVVPQEYGTTIAEKRSVGVKICHGLLEKIKYDLNVARTDNEVDMRYMINMAYSADLPINTMGRRIRTRLYFTSESHLHTVLSVFRFAECDKSTSISRTSSSSSSSKKGRKKNKHQHPVLSERGVKIINATPELCYLTQIVMRVFEDNRRPMNDPRRFRVEILFSPGATATPRVMDEKEREQDTSRFDTAPLQVIGRDGLTCQEVEDFFEQAIMAGRTDEDNHSPYDVASTVNMLEGLRSDINSSKTTQPSAPQQTVPAGKAVKVKASADEPKQPKVQASSATGARAETPGKHQGQDNNQTGDATAAAAANDFGAENATTLTRSNRASVGRALSLHRAESDMQRQASMEDKVDGAVAAAAAEVAQTRSVGGMDKDEKDGDDDNNDKGDSEAKKDASSTSPSQGNEEELSMTRKYFWGTVAVASFGLGAACLVMALTMDRRGGGSRRWSTTRGRY